MWDQEWRGLFGYTIYETVIEGDDDSSMILRRGCPGAVPALRGICHAVPSHLSSKLGHCNRASKGGAINN